MNRIKKLINKIKNLSMNVRMKYCKHSWAFIRKRPVYRINSDGVESSIPSAIVWNYECVKCGKKKELRMDVPI